MASGTAQRLTAHASTESFNLELHTGGGKKASLRIWLEAEAFRTLPGSSPGIATIRYELGGKKGYVKMPVYLARGMFIAARRCCSNVVSTQYGTRRSAATPPGKGKK